MKIELYIGYANHTWDTKIITIPDDTPSEEIEEVAVGYGEKEFFNNPNTEDEIAFVGIYSIGWNYIRKRCHNGWRGDGWRGGRDG